MDADEARMLEFEPIGHFRCGAKYTYDVPRQGTLAKDNIGVIELSSGRNFETALEGLEGFSRIWVLFVFDRNGDQWRPKVQPPRHIDHKVGVFATRSPYRPNPIGLSCVELLEIKGLRLIVRGHDLLDGTPILDVKPYLPYADSFPEASLGWTATGNFREMPVRFTAEANEHLAWLAVAGVDCLRDFIIEQLSEEPLNPKRHRLIQKDDGTILLAYRTWRALFEAHEDGADVIRILSGYESNDLAATDDKYHDKELHRRFIKQFYAPNDLKN